MFEKHQDVGTVLQPGSTEFDSAKKSYTITGSGTNMWFAEDDFQFAWKKMSGDVSLTAQISFPTTTGNEHKKAALIIRQSLDTDSVYADIARHGNGLTALQFRRKQNPYPDFAGLLMQLSCVRCRSWWEKKSAPSN